MLNRKTGLTVLLFLMSSAVLAQQDMNTVEIELPNLNQMDDENQIDRPDELQTASDTPHAMSAEELSKELSNPNSPLASLTIKQIHTSFDGDLPDANGQTSNVTLFQPAFPFPISDDGTTNLFIRPAFAYAWDQPVFDASRNKFRNESGLLDIGFDVAVGKSRDNGLIMIGGVQGSLPWGADNLSSDQYRLGPEFLIAKLSKKGFWAVFPAHQWDVSGGDDSYSTSQLELFAGMYLPNAWTIYSDSKLSYDWKSNQATVPINFTVRKVTKIGKTPLKIELGLDYFVEQDDRFGQDWAVTLNFSPVVPNFIYNMIK